MMLLASIFEAKLETVLMGKSGNWKPSKSEDKLDWHSKAIVSIEIRMKIRLSGKIACQCYLGHHSSQNVIRSG